MYLDMLVNGGEQDQGTGYGPIPLSVLKMGKLKNTLFLGKHTVRQNLGSNNKETFVSSCQHISLRFPLTKCEKEKKRKCAQTKTQERENVSGVFQVVAPTQTAEQ